MTTNLFPDRPPEHTDAFAISVDDGDVVLAPPGDTEWHLTPGNARMLAAALYQAAEFAEGGE